MSVLYSSAYEVYFAKRGKIYQWNFKVVMWVHSDVYLRRHKSSCHNNTSLNVAAPSTQSMHIFHISDCKDEAWWGVASLLLEMCVLQHTRMVEGALMCLNFFFHFVRRKHLCLFWTQSKVSATFPQSDITVRVEVYFHQTCFCFIWFRIEPETVT